RTDLTTADMITVGRELMDGKGLCFTCHTVGKSGALRFPDLDGIGSRAATSRPGLSDVEYLAESLYEPDIYIVPGFNPGMPVISKPPIGLTDDEILAVIAYLQSLGGTVTVNMQTKLAWQAGGAGGAIPGAEAAPVAGEAVPTGSDSDPASQPGASPDTIDPTDSDVAPDSDGAGSPGSTGANE
ncbi:MAG TPA: cytochrome c, partial [Thermoanaerobaculia bacterium]|nr:cytochrome c [Thermoanaerobaculia bacterium]